MSVTKNLSRYLNNIGVNLTVLSRKTGIPYPALYASLGAKSNNERELRADELCSVCGFLNLNPMDFTDFRKDRTA